MKGGWESRKRGTKGKRRREGGRRGIEKREKGKLGGKGEVFLHFIEFSPLIIEGCLSLYSMWFASVIDGRREGGAGRKEIRGRERRRV